MNKADYIKLRNCYKPRNLNTVFVLESPPISGKYFYDETGLVSEPLFAAMMELLKYKPKNKKEGLAYFSSSGHLLVDATYIPVNNMKDRERKNTIIGSYGELVDDLKILGAHSSVRLILIKANICRLLQDKLVQDGFNVANKGIVVPFPSTGQQGNFRKKMREVPFCK